MKPYLQKIIGFAKRMLQYVRRIVPQSTDTHDERTFKLVVLSGAGAVLAMIVIGMFTFLISLEGRVQTLVPNVVNTPLAEALLELQQKELQPHIQLRHFNDPASKGYVLEQSPAAGNLVRAGRTINLTVSKGAVVDTVSDFIGQDIDDVRAYLRTISATYDPLIRIGTISYVFSEQEAGTVIEQFPEAGTELVSLTDLDIVISRGPDVERGPVPSYVGEYYTDALQAVLDEGRVFEFAFAEADSYDSQAVGTVVRQEPAPGELAPYYSRVKFWIVPGANAGGSENVFSIFSTRLPDYPVRVKLDLQLIKKDGTVETLLGAEHSGGLFALPYLAQLGDVLVLSRLGTEIWRETVQLPQPTAVDEQE